MGNSTLQLLATIPGKPIFTARGKLYIGTLATSHTAVIDAASYTDTATLLAAIDMHKFVTVFEIAHERLNQIARHEFPKRLTRVLLPSREHVIVSDAFGDVYRLPAIGCLNLRQEQIQEQYRLLGHFSTVTDMCLDPSTIASGDRDSKIRISRYPESYVIQSFCLAHTEMVSCLLWWGDTLVSGGGDACIRLWKGGDQLCIASLEGLKDGDITVAKVVVSPFGGNKLIFALVDCCTLFEVALIDGRFENVNKVARFDDALTGMEVERDVVWLSAGKKMYKKSGGEFEPVDMGLREGDEDDGNEDECSRFSWLSRQRKKEMVENWKGKKRRYGQI